MSADKRQVATDALETLGTILDETAARDAIHLAVEPCIAGHYLNPGAHVGRMPDGRFGTVERTLGIVDPFLRNVVPPDQRFWLVVYPRQVTSLRHVWTHPDFPEVTVDPAQRKKSEEWLREYARNSDGPGYGDLMAAIENHEGGEYLFIYGDAHGQIPHEMWDHAEVVTGKKIPVAKRAEWFSCSC